MVRQTWFIGKRPRPHSSSPRQGRGGTLRGHWVTNLGVYHCRLEELYDLAESQDLFRTIRYAMALAKRTLIVSFNCPSSSIQYSNLRATRRRDHEVIQRTRCRDDCVPYKKIDGAFLRHTTRLCGAASGIGPVTRWRCLSRLFELGKL